MLITVKKWILGLFFTSMNSVGTHLCQSYVIFRRNLTKNWKIKMIVRTWKIRNSLFSKFYHTYLHFSSFQKGFLMLKSFVYLANIRNISQPSHKSFYIWLISQYFQFTVERSRWVDVPQDVIAIVRTSLTPSPGSAVVYPTPRLGSTIWVVRRPVWTSSLCVSISSLMS